MAVPNITLAGNMLDLFGVAHAGSLTVQLAGYGAQDPRVPGTALIGLTSPEEIDCLGGAYSFDLWGNDQITPAGTYYTVVVKDAAGNLIQILTFQFAGIHTYDLSNLAQYIPVPNPPAPSSAVVTNPAGGLTQTIAGGLVIEGNLTVTGASTFNFGVYDVPIGAAIQFNGLFGYAQNLLLTQNVGAATAINFPAGFPLPFFIVQDAVGGRTFVWPANFKNPPVINPAPNGVTSQAFALNPDGNYYPLGNAVWS